MGCILWGFILLTGIGGFFFWPLWILTLCGVVLALKAR
jgi:hypothetical protein